MKNNFNMACIKTTWQPCQNPYYFLFGYLQQRIWMQNAPVVNNVIGNWKLLKKKSCFSGFHMMHIWTSGTVISGRQSVFFCMRRHCAFRPATRYRFCSESQCFFFPHQVTSTMHAFTLLLKWKKKSSQFYLISWKGKAFSRSLIKCTNTEGGCLASRPVLLAESSRERGRGGKKQKFTMANALKNHPSINVNRWSQAQCKTGIRTRFLRGGFGPCYCATLKVVLYKTLFVYVCIMRSNCSMTSC